MAIRFGDPEQNADCLQRDLAGDVVHHIERGGVVDGVEQQQGAAAQLDLQTLHHAPGQPRADEPPKPRMTRIVHHVQHDPGDRQVGEQRAAVGTIAAALGGIRLRIAEHLAGLGERRHRPEALTVRGVARRLVPVNGPLTPMARKERMREALSERVEIGEVDPGHDLLHVRSLSVADRQVPVRQLFPPPGGAEATVQAVYGDIVERAASRLIAKAGRTSW